MKFWKNQKGFSLIELIVVIGIAAIIASVSLRMISLISATNTEKVVKTLSDALTKQQMRSMSKVNKPNLFVYTVDETYYYALSEESTYNASTMGTKGKEIGKGVEISYNDDGGNHVISNVNILKISFKRDGSFDEAPDSIVIKGKLERTIKLNKSTGKHVIK